MTERAAATGHERAARVSAEYESCGAERQDEERTVFLAVVTPAATRSTGKVLSIARSLQRRTTRITRFKRVTRSRNPGATTRSKDTLFRSIVTRLVK